MSEFDKYLTDVRKAKKKKKSINEMADSKDFKITNNDIIKFIQTYGEKVAYGINKNYEVHKQQMKKVGRAPMDKQEFILKQFQNGHVSFTGKAQSPDQ